MQQGNECIMATLLIHVKCCQPSAWTLIAVQPNQNNLQKMLKRVSDGLNRLHKAFSTLKTICLVPHRLQTTAVAPESEQTDDTETKKKSLTDLRYKYPEFLPCPILRLRNPVKEELEVEDMMRRRQQINIPEFYVGTILAVTSSDQHSPGKLVRFLGICIQRGGYGLRAYFTLRNVIENEGVEVSYELYNPLIQKIEVMKLEKRLDNELLYLRDAPLQYSTFPFDMDPQYINKDAEVPINTIKVPLNPRPWIQRYERMNLQGVILPELSEKIMKKAEAQKKPWEKYDLMDIYRKCVSEEEITDLFSKVHVDLKHFEQKQKMEKQRKELIKIQRQKLF